MIPTRRKEKLPSGFSYPVGAKAVSAALRDVPHYDELELVFSWQDSFWASEYQERLKAKGKVCVIDAGYFGGWSIHIHSVPSAYASSAREQLLSSALSGLAGALAAAPADADGFRWAAALDLSSSVLHMTPNYVLQRTARIGRARYRSPVRPRGR